MSKGDREMELQGEVRRVEEELAIMRHNVEQARLARIENNGEKPPQQKQQLTLQQQLQYDEVLVEDFVEEE